MSDKLIGMYVLMMWGYNYPYAARTWQLKDWSAYLEGLRALGYNLVQIWPFVDAIPVGASYSGKRTLQIISTGPKTFLLKDYFSDAKLVYPCRLNG